LVAWAAAAAAAAVHVAIVAADAVGITMN